MFPIQDFVCIILLNVFYNVGKILAFVFILFSQVTMTSTSSASYLQNRKRVFTKTRPQNQMYRVSVDHTVSLNN